MRCLRLNAILCWKLVFAFQFQPAPELKEAAELKTICGRHLLSTSTTGCSSWSSTAMKVCKGIPEDLLLPILLLESDFTLPGSLWETSPTLVKIGKPLPERIALCTESPKRHAGQEAV